MNTCVVFVLILTIVAAEIPPEIQKHYEFEDALSGTQQHLWQWRSEASMLKTLRIEDEAGTSEVRFHLCVTPYNASLNVSVQIDDIRYSNDGESDNITVKFANYEIATFTTTEKWKSGHEWNVFRNTGRLGPLMTVPPGQYTIQVLAQTDLYGVEFDRIRINAENQDPMSEIFCGAQVLL